MHSRDCILQQPCYARTQLCIGLHGVTLRTRWVDLFPLRNIPSASGPSIFDSCGGRG